MIEVIQPGLLTTIQDSGRNGYEAYGVPRSGFFDPFLASIANHLVGNSLDTPVLEFAMMGPVLEFQEACSISLVGFDVHFQRETERISDFCAVAMKKGDRLKFHAMKGWFGYIGIAGGISSDRILGSVSTHFAANIGKRLSKGDRLQFGTSTQRWKLLPELHPRWNDPMLSLVTAHHTQDFPESAIRSIAEKEYLISTTSNRMGIRLDGTALETVRLKRSVPALIGAVQVPASGMPIILGPEGPTTGGYAQIGILTRNSWTTLAGMLPGSSFRFHWMEADSARRDWQKRQKLFAQTEAWIPV